ncbi:DNA polymerase alpha catalytic subunit [Zancudomyces culisetae]|uniref:DNA polymerase n=1 Tax=Zancudomyces culisetae TaxID=1213189 RepID=A0A1R1PJN9_ZANCU|nr:DNA polymerase alpha catalytic subunit [Zancudomyces culisetae]|eukprot:OMH81149.1 DNA polymerase alpha catalytic subunit [Zancudomyces culisetae]
MERQKRTPKDDVNGSNFYEEVSEGEYEKAKIEEEQLDDFIVDDDGTYAEGLHTFDHKYHYYSSEEETGEKAKSGKGKSRGKGKEKERASDEANRKGSDKKRAMMNPFFKAMQEKAVNSNGNFGEDKKGQADEEQFMNNLLGGLGGGGKKQQTKKRKSVTEHVGKLTKPQRYVHPKLSMVEEEKVNHGNHSKKIKSEQDKVVQEIKNELQNDEYAMETVDEEPFEFENQDFKVDIKDLDLEATFNDDNESVAGEFSKEEIEELIRDETKGMDDWLAVQRGILMDKTESQASSQGSIKNNDLYLGSDDVRDDYEFESIDMYWIDAYEKNGTVYLFGKTGRGTNKNVLTSVCVVVKDIERNIFVLPKAMKDGAERYPASQAYKEVEQMLLKHGVKEFATKPVQRKYAFEDSSVPAAAEYLKVVYGFNYPQLPSDLTGETVDKVFGTSYSALELLLLKRRIMGPCWLRIAGIQKSSPKISWCRQEYVVNNPKNIKVLTEQEREELKYPQTPPLSVAAITLKTALNRAKESNEIVAASFMWVGSLNVEDNSFNAVRANEHVTMIRQMEGIPFPTDFERLATQQTQKAIEARGKQNIQVFKTERLLLLSLVAMLARTDPDVIVGHNFLGFGLDVLLHRMKVGKIADWSKLGRAKRSVWPKLQTGAGGMGESTFEERQIMSGRIVCDTYLTAKDLIKSKSYGLTQLALSELHIKREDMPLDRIEKAYTETSSPEPLLHLCKHTAFDANLCVSLAVKIQALMLTKQLTTLAGNLWSRTLVGARAERNEFLLLHEFYREKYIRPDKFSFKLLKKPKNTEVGSKSNANINANANTNANATLDSEVIDNTYTKDEDGADSDDQDEAKTQNLTSANISTSRRRKPAYSGGLVLEPLKGLYDNYVVLLDFNSLYPSIIQEFNICFTTVERSQTEDQVPPTPDPSLPIGILPRLLKTLVERRREVKKLLKNPKLSEGDKLALDIRQKALKLTANSMYGCLGFTYSRFYAKPLAILITAKGRQILMDTKTLAESQDLQVVYGDTDSIMINTTVTDLNEAYKLGANFKRQVNERYKLLELDIDGVFKRLLLLKKKKYAALLVTGPAPAQSSSNDDPIDAQVPTQLETRGLDLVRRDWCELSQSVSTYVLKLLLNTADTDSIAGPIYGYLSRISSVVRANGFPLNKFVITKGLNKAPEAYGDAHTQPHVCVALRMKKAGYSFSSGDTVPYIICTTSAVVNGTTGSSSSSSSTSNTSSALAARAYHPEEINNSGGTILVDFEWYLSQQIYPPISRLCEPINEIDHARIASSLGLEASKYISYLSKPSNQTTNELKTFDSQISDAERFKDSDPLELTCQGCGNKYQIFGIAQVRENRIVNGLQCECGALPNFSTLVNQIILQIRQHIFMYNQGELVCNDIGCDFRTQQSLIHSSSALNHSTGTIRCLRHDIGCSGTLKRAYTERSLYNQLLYYSTLFDLKRTRARIADTFKDLASGDIDRTVGNNYTTRKSEFDTCFNTVKSYLDVSAFRFVDLGSLFKSLKI